MSALRAPALSAARSALLRPALPRYGRVKGPFCAKRVSFSGNVARNPRTVLAKAGKGFRKGDDEKVQVGETETAATSFEFGEAEETEEPALAEEAVVVEEPVVAEEAVVAEEPAVSEEPEAATADGFAVEEVPSATMPEDMSMDIEDLKACLLDSFYGTERGFTASSEARAEVNELVTQLEAVNPTSNPTDELAKLEGTWKLVFQNNSELALLSLAFRTPALTLGDIYQTISSETLTVENMVEVLTPVTKGSISTSANIEVRSPKRLQVQFVEGKVSTPKLVQDFVLPDRFEVAGQSLDLSPFRDFFSQVQQAITPLASLLESQPDFQFPISNENAQGWLLTTYLDEDLRIARGDGGSVFILTRD